MKFGQLIETLFLKNHTQNEMEKLFPDLFFKKIKIEHIFGSIVQSFIKLCFYYYYYYYYYYYERIFLQDKVSVLYKYIQVTKN